MSPHHPKPLAHAGPACIRCITLAAAPHLPAFPPAGLFSYTASHYAAYHYCNRLPARLPALPACSLVPACLQAVKKANELFDKYASGGRDGRLTLPELQQLMREASQEFPHLREHLTFLDG